MFLLGRRVSGTVSELVTFVEVGIGVNRILPEIGQGANQHRKKSPGKARSNEASCLNYC